MVVTRVPSKVNTVRMVGESCIVRPRNGRAIAVDRRGMDFWEVADWFKRGFGEECKNVI